MMTNDATPHNTSGNCSCAECRALLRDPPVRPTHVRIPIEHFSALTVALAPLAMIANEYDTNNLDEERPQWRNGPLALESHVETPFSEIELFSGRGGKRLLTLQDAFNARDALNGKQFRDGLVAFAEPPLNAAKDIEEGRVVFTFAPFTASAEGAPIKRWPFAESPGDIAKQLYRAYWNERLSAEDSMLPAVRQVFIENPPALAPWLNPGATAIDSRKLFLLETALRHAFPHFQGEEPITTEAILAIGKEYESATNIEPSSIDFVDADGNERKLTYSDVDGVQGGWELDGYVAIDSDRFDAMLTAAAKAQGLLNTMLVTWHSARVTEQMRFSEDQAAMIDKTVKELKDVFSPEKPLETKAETLPAININNLDDDALRLLAVAFPGKAMPFAAYREGSPLVGWGEDWHSAREALLSLEAEAPGSSRP